MTAAGIYVRHRKDCAQPRDDGKCCAAGWQAMVYDKRTDKRLRKTFATRSAAKQWRQDALVALRHGAPAATAGRTVADTMTSMLAGMRAGTVLDRSGRRYRPATVRSYAQAWSGYLEPALGRLRLQEVRRGDVQRLVDQMHAGGLSGSTIRNKLDPLRVLYRRALEDEQVTRNPTSHLRLPENKARPRRVVNVQRADELLDALPDTDRALWATAVYTGMRIGELRALRWTHVDFDAGVIHVRAGWDDVEGEQETKTAAGVRVIPLAGRLRAELARHKLATGRTGDDLVFGRTAAAAFTRTTMRSRANRGVAGSRAASDHAARDAAHRRVLHGRRRPDTQGSADGARPCRHPDDVERVREGRPGVGDGGGGEARPVPRCESLAKVRCPAGRFVAVRQRSQAVL